MMMNIAMRTANFIICAALLAGLMIPSVAIAGWVELKAEAEAAKAELDAVVAQAQAVGVDTGYATVTQKTVDDFLLWAQKDYDTGYESADPFYELQSCIDIADRTIAELRDQMAGNIVLKPPLSDYRSGTMSVDFNTGTCLRNGEPFFVSQLKSVYGWADGTIWTLSWLKDATGVFKANVLNNFGDDIANEEWTDIFLMPQIPSNLLPSDVPADRATIWQNIDHPEVRQMLGCLVDGVAGKAAAKKGSEAHIYQLGNEVHFHTAKDGWETGTTVNTYTMEKYVDWLSAKYGSVDDLNTTYGTSYTNFSQTKFAINTPIDPAALETLRGGPVWYDWNRFNMDRVNEFYQFMHDRIKTNDPAALITLKIWGYQFDDPSRDHGIDFEYMAGLLDLPGWDMDFRPRDGYWAADWYDDAIIMDFYRSMASKPCYNPEWHGWSTSGWREPYIPAGFARMAVWQEFSTGMGKIRPWYVARNSDGSAPSSSGFDWSVYTQPIQLDEYGRAMRELVAHAPTVTDLVNQERIFNIYYCEEAAIQANAYWGWIKKLHKALKLSNERMGFTTPSKIGTLSPATQTVMVPPTKFISDASLAALQSFAAAGGKVILVNESDSFKMDELGFDRTGGAGFTPYDSITLSGDEFDIVLELENILPPMRPAKSVTVDVFGEDSNTEGVKAYGVFENQVHDPATGETEVLLINLTTSPRIISLQQSKGLAKKYANLFTSTVLDSTFIMQPRDVILLKEVPGSNAAPAFSTGSMTKPDGMMRTAYCSTLAGAASDADGDPLTYSVAWGPAWLNVAADGTLSGTPADADVGSNSWLIQVSDGNGGFDTATLDISIQSAPTKTIALSLEDTVLVGLYDTNTTVAPLAPGDNWYSGADAGQVRERTTSDHELKTQWYFRFNDSILTNIPSGDITAATLKLPQIGRLNTRTDDSNLAIYDAEMDWNLDGSNYPTWDVGEGTLVGTIMDAYNTFGTVKDDSDSNIEGTFEISTAELLATVRGWAENPERNDGFMVKWLSDGLVGLAFGAPTLVITTYVFEHELANDFDGDDANDTGSGFQIVRNDAAGLTDHTSDASIGRISFRDAGDSTPHVGLASTRLVNLGNASGFTLTWVVGSTSASIDPTNKGMFLGFQDSIGNTTNGSSLWNNDPRSVGLRITANDGLFFAENAGEGSLSDTTLLTNGTLNAASCSDGFTVSLTLNDDDTWRAATTGLNVDVSTNGVLSSISYADIAGSVYPSAYLQSNSSETQTVNYAAVSLYPLPDQPAAIQIGTEAGGALNLFGGNLISMATYTLQGRTNLLEGTWLEIASTTGVTQVDWSGITSTNTTMFYRIKLEQ